MTVNEIIRMIERSVPKTLAMQWDNPGLLVGRGDREVSCIYVALDCTEPVIRQAVACGAQMIITHHPMIFSPVKQINDGDFIGRRILELAENKISYYAMHTNFDVAVMAELAADRMGLKYKEPLEVTIPAGTMGYETAMGIGCAGRLPQKMTLEECARMVKTVFEIPSVRFFGNAQAPVVRTGICPGSGKHMTSYALQTGCDVLITGDIDHHEGIDAVSQGLLVIDAGHHGIEHIFTEYMQQYLKKKVEEIRVEREENIAPFTVL